MKKVLFFIYSLTFILSCNQGINSYKDGKKDGKWIEYLNEDFTNEVPKDSAKYYRDIFYENGFPKGVVKDYYISGKPQWEGLIISGPYLKDQERPKTKSTGLCIWFDEKTALIRDWSYKDDQGLIDYRRYYFSGYDDIEKDKRFNKGFWLALDKENPLTDNAFKETKKNPMILADIIDEGAKVNFVLKNGTDAETNNQNSKSLNNNNYQQQSSLDNQSSNTKGKCSYCNGSGRCRECNRTFEVRYWNNGWRVRNESRPGQIMCPTCHGSGLIYGSAPINGRDPESKPCYIGGCHNGWLVCNECNYDGGGQNPGMCSHCKGSGYN